MRRHLARSLVVMLLLVAAPGLIVRDALGAPDSATTATDPTTASLLVARTEASLSPVTEGQQVEIVAPKGADLVAIRKEIALHDQLSRQWLTANPAEKDRIGHQIKVLAVRPAGVTQFSPTNAEKGAIFLPFTSASRDFCAVALVSAGYCHAGIFDSDRYTGVRTQAAIRTANTAANSPGGDGAKWETIRYWNNTAYSEVREMTVPLATAQQKATAVATASTYQGSYAISPIWTNGSWYCSKVVWRSYFAAAKIPLGPVTIVSPGDIRWSPFTSTVRVYR